MIPTSHRSRVSRDDDRDPEHRHRFAGRSKKAPWRISGGKSKGYVNARWWTKRARVTDRGFR